MPMRAIKFDDDVLRDAETLVELAIAEDLGTPRPHLSADRVAGRIKLDFGDRKSDDADLTSLATIPGHARGTAHFVARADGVIAGLPMLALVARSFGLLGRLHPLVADGDRVAPGVLITKVSGPMRELLGFERIALNFLQRLSGIATLTDRFVRAISGTRAVILDTRKTTPGWRSLEKYAVRCGGGENHRFGLYDAVLIKDNHLAWLAFAGHEDPIGAAVAAARAKAPPHTIIEVEVDTLEQLDRALAARPDIVLVDNLGPEGLKEAVRRRDARAESVQLEASGGVNLETVAGLARTGVDRISVGALTHSAPALDIGLDFDRGGHEPS